MAVDVYQQRMVGIKAREGSKDLMVQLYTVTLYQKGCNTRTTTAVQGSLHRTRGSMMY
jgi:hypothetical protein